MTGRAEHLAAAGAGLSLALLTKGIAALLPVPGILLYALVDPRRRALTLRWPVVACGLAACLPVAVAYGLIERTQPGFLAATISNDLLARFGAVVPGGTPRGLGYYLEGLLAYRFMPWIYALPVALLRPESFARFAAVYLIAFLVVISASATKFHWYDAPFYPVAAIAVGLLLEAAIRAWSRMTGRTQLIPAAAIFVLPALQNVYVEFYAHGMIFRENSREVSLSADQHKRFLRNVAAKLAPASQVFVVNGHRYNTPLLWVTRVERARSGLALQTDWEEAFRPVPAGFAYVVNCFGAAGRTTMPGRPVAAIFADGAGCELLRVGQDDRAP